MHTPAAQAAVVYGSVNIYWHLWSRKRIEVREHMKRQRTRYKKEHNKILPNKRIRTNDTKRNAETEYDRVPHRDQKNNDNSTPVHEEQATKRNCCTKISQHELTPYQVFDSNRVQVLAVRYQVWIRGVHSTTYAIGIQQWVTSEWECSGYPDSIAPRDKPKQALLTIHMSSL